MSHLDYLSSLLNDGKLDDIDARVMGVFNEYLQPNSATTAEAAAEAINALTPAKRRESGIEPVPTEEEAQEPEDFLWNLWSGFNDISCRIPHDHAAQDKMVDFLQALKQLPPVTVKAWGSKTELWTGLPLLGPAVREAWIGPFEDKQYPQTELDQWINRNAFLARWTAACNQAGWIHFAIWSLRDAFEDEPAKQAEVRECRLGAAAQWFIYSGQDIFRLAKEGRHSDESYDDFDRITKPGPLYKGESGFTMARWSFWVSKLRNFHDLMNEDVKDSVLLAIRRAEELEN